MENIQLLYIDLFCGAGGTSTGVEESRIYGEKCAKVIACVNHDPHAIASHMANHKDVMHFTEDIRTLDTTMLVSHLKNMRNKYPDAKVVLWASLECTNFSKAKGGLPRDADSRTLAEHLFRYIDDIDPDFIHIENVEEFMSWGELDEKGKPLSSTAGSNYVRWVNRVCDKYGYYFDYRILNAADYGAYTSRKRFFGQFAKPGLPIIFPEPTHSKKGEPTLFGKVEKWKAVREVLDLEDEGKSIFNREKPLVEKTLERIYAGLIKFVAGGKDKYDAWILKYNSTSHNGVHCPPSINEPCPTVATQNRLGLVKCNFLSKQFSGEPCSKNISIDNPAGTITCKDHHAFITAYYGKVYNSSIESPCPTVTTKDRLSTVTCFIDNQYGKGTPSSAEEPSGTICTNPKQSIVSCKRDMQYLMNPQFNSFGSSINQPCFTLIARMDKRPPYIISAQHDKQDRIMIEDVDSPMTRKIKTFMNAYGIVDIRMRMLKIQELKKIMGFPSDYVLIGTQAEQKKYIGNAVEVNMSRALCQCLCNALRKREVRKNVG